MSRSCRNDRHHGTSDGRKNEKNEKKEEKEGDRKSKEKHKSSPEKQTQATNGPNFSDLFRRLIDPKFDAFLSSIRTECKSHQNLLQRMCESHVKKGQNIFLQEALSLDANPPFASCEMSGRRALLSGLEFVSNELTRIEAAAYEEQCRWDAIIQTMSCSIGSGCPVISTDSQDRHVVTMAANEWTGSHCLSPQVYQESMNSSISPKQTGDSESSSTLGSHGKGRGQKKSSRKNKK